MAAGPTGATVTTGTAVAGLGAGAEQRRTVVAVAQAAGTTGTTGLAQAAGTAGATGAAGARA